MTLLFLANALVCQWFGFRIAKQLAGDDVISWGILGPVLPLTGWGSPYIGWANFHPFPK